MILSHSEIALYQACPRKYRFKYVDKRVGLIPNEALLGGKRVHTALALWWDGQSFDPRSLTPAERAMMRGYHSVYGEPPKSAEVNVPFRVNISPGLTIVGECDAKFDSTIVEHKTTSSDISPGGQYWTRVVLVDPQVSLYSLAFPGSTVLYDVLRKPALRQKQGESELDYENRCLSAMAEDPTKYFARFTVVRLEQEAKDTIEDIKEVAWRIETAQNYERNPRACFEYGRECEYFGACFEGKDIMGAEFTDWPGHELAWVAKERAPDDSQKEFT